MKLASFSRFSLVPGPTPLQRATRLERALGPSSPRIYLKRDDLTGLAYGGNKGRKLEYLVADAIAQGATVLITEGAVQSNHARMTAAAAVLAGVKSHLILDARNGREEQGNLLLDRLLGAECTIVDSVEEREAARESVPARLREQGETPYLIPTGGSNPLGALGYVQAAYELASQLLELGESPTALYSGTGSQGTLAGLEAGAVLTNASWDPVSISVSGTDETQLRVDAAALTNATLALIDSPIRIDASDIAIDAGYVGAGYGKATEGSLEAIHLLARTEAVFLDPVYTGKAMSALIDHVRAGRYDATESIIFIHTGGTPSLFVHRDILLAGAG